MAQGGMGKKRCHFPPEGDTIGNAITRKCKLGMLTYITMDISVCPPEWYQSAKFRVLAHALEGIGIYGRLYGAGDYMGYWHEVYTKQSEITGHWLRAPAIFKRAVLSHMTF